MECLPILLCLAPEYDLEPCQDPGTPKFGWHSGGGQLGIGDSLVFACESGFRLQGAREIVCLGGGRRVWSAPLPRCVGTWSAAFICLHLTPTTPVAAIQGLRLKPPAPYLQEGQKSQNSELRMFQNG